MIAQRAIGELSKAQLTRALLTQYHLEGTLSLVCFRMGVRLLEEALVHPLLPVLLEALPAT